MDYFDFEEASHTLPDLAQDGCLSTCPQSSEVDGEESFESLLFDKSASLPHNHSVVPGPMMLKLINDVEIEVIPHEDDSARNYPMFRAKIPCELCRKMGLDCFLAQRGNMINGCTCCISLYRECSFTHQTERRGYTTTFDGISEDHEVSRAPGQKQVKSLRSFESAAPRKTGARFSRDAVKCLRQWLAEHADHPYPSDREKYELKRLTGLKRSQISNWLANARRRGKVRPVSSPSSPVLGAIDIPPRTINAEGVDITEMNPLDRWKISPPENEPATVTAIAKAVSAAPQQHHAAQSSSCQGSRTNSRRTSSEDEKAFSLFQAPSVSSSLKTSDSSTSNFSRGSSRSHNSTGSFASSQDRRRRRRAPMTQRVTAQTAKSRSARIFQCTFCTDTFPAKYDWQRHEKSLHLALERWTCCPTGATFPAAASGCQHCVFCQEVNPTAEHLETHNFGECMDKTAQERTFYRKDHLRQHLKLVHGTKFEAHMESWKSTTNEVKSRCGFCPSVFSTWQQRADHLAAHFRNGSDMASWSGSWGFEPYVERLVDNAMPPYLIGHERQSMDPFVAKATTPVSGGDTELTFGTSASCTEYQIAQDSNCWGRLERELTKYIEQQKAEGIWPADQDLQDRSRWIIYDDDDPWNQTPADNKQWLDTLKYQLGIGPCPAEVQRPEEVPICPPFVVRGGLKGGRAGSMTQEPRTSGTFTPDPNAVSMGDLDPAMDIDFDQLDFGNLDLGMMDNVDFMGTPPAPSMGFADVTDVIQQEMGQAFGSSDMPIDVGKMQMEQQQQNVTSVQDLDQLTSYMAGFQH